MAPPQRRTIMENLPCEVLSEIFIRLLAKQLAQMRCVCKSWNALLSKSSFIKSHLERSTQNNNEILMFFLNDFLNNCGSFKACPSCSPDLELTNFITFPINTQSEKKHVIGSVNGLVCFYNQSYFNDYVIGFWNPSLSAVLTLPPLPLPSRDSYYGFGFGYDPKTDDYKVVKITRLYEPPNMVTQTEVYSMRKGSWELISQRFPSHITGVKCYKQVYLHGHIHWLCCIKDNPKLQTIVSFDVGAETFSEIPLPDSIIDYNVYNSSDFFGVLGGKLCVMSRIRDGNLWEVWVMDEYGVVESWVKLHAFSKLSGDVIPYGFTSCKEFLFRYKNSLDCFGLYNPVSSKTKTFKITMGLFSYISKIIEYVDSLVWITPAKKLQI